MRNHPALKGVTIPRTGQSGAVGALVTKTLVIAGDPLATTRAGPRARRDAARVRQEDGKEVGAVYMPAQQSGTPMTYALNGKQYIVVADQRRHLLAANTSRSLSGGADEER